MGLLQAELCRSFSILTDRPGKRMMDLFQDDVIATVLVVQANIGHSILLSVELAENREAKASRRKKMCSFQSMAREASCSNLGLDHRFFRVAQGHYGGKKSVMDGMATSLNEVNLVL